MLLQDVEQDVEVLVQDSVGRVGTVGDPVAIVAAALEHPVLVNHAQPEPAPGRYGGMGEFVSQLTD